jgi:multidrug resistance efflux pump
MKRRLITLAVLLILAGGAAFWLTRPRNSVIVLTGIVTTDDVIVSSSIPGRLDQLLVKEGDTVAKGQLLALIEPKELAADQAFYEHAEESSKAQVSQAEAALRYQERQTRDEIERARATLAAAEAQLKESIAQQDLAQSSFDRARGLKAEGIVSAQAFDEARTGLDAAKARVEALRKQVGVQQAALALAESSAEQIAVRRAQLAAGQHQVEAAGAQTRRATVRLGYTEVSAPIAGLVSIRAARVGEVVNAGQPILSLINLDDLWVRADVEESYIERVRMGDAMDIRFPSGDRQSGKVFYRGAVAGYATQRDVSRSKRDIKTFEIRLRVDNSARRIYPGLTAFVTLPAQEPGR